MVSGKNFTQAIGNNSVRWRSHSDSDFVIEISREREIIILPTLTKLSFPEYQQTAEADIAPSYTINQSKSMIYFWEYNTVDFGEYNQQLKNILTC